ncbi:MAG: class E sortase [Actinomycetota bacterium]
MGRREDRSKRRRRTFLFVAALGLVLGAVTLGGVILSSAGGLWPTPDLLGAGEEPVGEVERPSGESAPSPAKDPEPKEKQGEDGPKESGERVKKQDGEKAGGEGAGREGIEAELAAVPEPPSTEMYLTVPKMGLQNDYVAEGVDDATLMNGAGHAPGTGYPWIPGSNTYIASHVLGYAGTGSYMHFAALPSMTYGDEIILTDTGGTTYKYVVSEILEVSIYDTWVMQPTGKSQISLQTCINPPAYDVRLVVRGDLVDVQRA